MKKIVQSPWFGVSLGIAGLIVGYSFVIAKNPSSHASGAECPADYICQGAHCDKSPGCEDGLCSEKCPGNCPQHS